jgi:hypothetical protein
VTPHGRLHLLPEKKLETFRAKSGMVARQLYGGQFAAAIAFHRRNPCGKGSEIFERGGVFFKKSPFREGFLPNKLSKGFASQDNTRNLFLILVKWTRIIRGV